MNTPNCKKKLYVKPAIEVLKVDTGTQIVSGSPTVQPGGSSVIVVPPVEDGDEEISGVKRFNMWENVGDSWETWEK